MRHEFPLGVLSRFVFSCSHKGLTMSAQELSSTAKVQDSTFKFQVQMVLFNGPWFAVSDPQSKLISSSLPGKDRRHSYSCLSSTLLVEPFSLRLRFNGSHGTIQGPWFKFKSMLLSSMAQEQRDTCELNGLRPAVKVY